MSIFNAALSQVTTADLQDLLQTGAVENVRLEFKSAVPDKDETLKKLSSFANTFGGYVVVGAKANSANGRIEDLPGVDEQLGYKQKVVQWCFDGTSPPVIVEVSDPIPTPSANGKFCYVIYTAESETAPHFVNGRKGVWVRTDEFSQRYEPKLATENEIRHLLDRRRLITERRDHLIGRSVRRFHTLLTQYPAPKKLPFLQVSIGASFPAHPVCEHGKLVSTLQGTRVNWRQASFPYTSAKCVSQHESALFVTPRDANNQVGLIEANVWGVMFYGIELEIEIDSTKTLGMIKEPISGIHLYRLVGYLLVFAEHAKQMIAKCGYEGSVTVQVALNGIRGVHWLYTQTGADASRGPRSELDDEFLFSLPSDTESLKHRRDAIVRDVLQLILFGMNWPDYAASTNSLEQLLRDGYRYNFWGDPTALQL